jgi:hypothetical protein
VNQKSLKAAGAKAAIDAAMYMTADLRHSAMKSGWGMGVSSNLNVMYTGSAYDIHVDEMFKEEAMDMEYGTPNQRPTAVFRKYGNRTHQAEKAFIRSLEKETGWQL